jgi:hypothetical protein
VEDIPDVRDGGAAPGCAPLLALLYRYLWPMWLFRDASRGTALERAAAYRHNRSVSRHLPGYVGKWSAIAAITLLAMRGAELVASAGTACALFCALLGVWLAWALTVVLVLAAAWLYMETVPR